MIGVFKDIDLRSESSARSFLRVNHERTREEGTETNSRANKKAVLMFRWHLREHQWLVGARGAAPWREPSMEATSSSRQVATGG